MTVKGGDKVFKELLNKMKSIKNICAAFAAGRIYSPYVRAVMEAAKEEEERQEAEKIKYAKGGIVEPFKQRFELDKDEVILTAEEWIKTNPELWEAARELVIEAQIQEQRKIERRNTNNWRKMHGLPMRRKARSRTGEGGARNGAGGIRKTD